MARAESSTTAASRPKTAPYRRQLLLKAPCGRGNERQHERHHDCRKYSRHGYRTFFGPLASSRHQRRYGCSTSHAIVSRPLGLFLSNGSALRASSSTARPAKAWTSTTWLQPRDSQHRHAVKSARSPPASRR
jgi:hypothetical protein